jgi:cardiolipin synthase A/B
MMKVNWILLHILPILGFFLAVTLFVQQRLRRRSPSSTMAWLLAILLVPYIGVPAYLIFGGRKIRRMTKNKADLSHGVNFPEEQLINRGVGSIFPPRNGNEITLLATGEKACETLVDLIEHAKKSIDISTYILGNDETGSVVLSALTRKAEQGVAVRLLLDALGSFRVSKKRLAPLLAGGGRYAFFMPMMHLPFRGRANLRNHRKIIIVDGVTAIVGGMNIASDYMGMTVSTQRWHDLSFLVKGPVLADLHHVFHSDWQFAEKRKIADEDFPVAARVGATTTLELVPSGPDVVGDPLYESIVTTIFKAQDRVWIITPYFIPDEMLLKAICIAARRGVDVRIVVPLISNHPIADLVRRSYLREAQDNGVKICNFTPGMMHAKAILVDGTLGIVGSMNMDMRSFFLNYEVAMFIYDENMVKELDAWVTDLLHQCVLGIKKANIAVEFIEGVARLLSPLL